ncbi:unnamed protein product [Ilex paraguariensis]|uniref:PHD-type domain-containing protein n=1 Tax=Ilex paraguariensis TaxID=185542 RepID=A0ABC8UPH6_9AQUA
MRLSRSASIAKRRKDQKLGNCRARKKHKRLDAICEKAYNRNHGGVKAESSEGNAETGLVGSELELRRSTRVRKAPVVLDASPPLPKKRQKIDKNRGFDSSGSVKMEDEVKSEPPCSTSGGLEQELDSWKSRLRSRARNASFRGREKGEYLLRGKRKLFMDFDGVVEEPKLKVVELNQEEEGLEVGKSTVVKSKRPGRIKASNVLRTEDQGIGLGGVKEDSREMNKGEVLVVTDGSCINNEMECGNDGEVKDDNAAPQSIENEESKVQNGLQLEECRDEDNLVFMEQNKQVEQSDCLKEGENQGDAGELGRVSSDQVEDGGCHNKQLGDENPKKVGETSCALTYEFNKPRIKEGRRCGLCGGGTDGKPPKTLVHYGAGSENEAYSGSSASEEPNYDIWDGFGDEPGWLGRLLGPVNDRFGIAGIWVHQHCAVWSPEVYFAGLGCLKNVRAALCRGRVLKCTRCGRPGATIGCRVDRCPKTYHLPCARANGCIFDHRKFLIACTDHRHLFQPYGPQSVYRLKKIKAKKIKLGMRKLSNDAWRKDHEAEEKWLENCGEDEEFLKRESKRLHRDLLRIAPVYIGGSNMESKMQFQGWESVAGLQGVIQCLKEVAIIPLLYPEFYNNLGLTPPRGVLLHGHPGTGKTLVVRALIGSCARGDKQIAYFARKGADCLGKYVGDAERQLRLLFQVAEKAQPSIIFFDEIDGLAPCRTRQQDQTHSSVVSTLLALMDGLKSRGSVVVIGATNRPDAVDPALRRPGRFDREIYFPLPSVKDREAILLLHTQKWPKPVSGSLLKWIARRTVGFAGADLQALCTQAAIIALKRSCPLQKLLSTSGEEAPHGKRPPLPTSTVEERDWLEALSCMPPPCSRREAGMAANDVVASPLQDHLLPCLLQPLSRLLVSFHLDERVWVPPPLSKAAALVKNIIMSALDKKKVRSDCWWSHVHDLLQEADVASEIQSNLSHAHILVGNENFAQFEDSDDNSDENSLKPEPSKLHRVVAHTSLLQNMSGASGKISGFRILISGNPRSGQRHLASCLLHCFVGNVEIRKVDLATISQEGHGDVMQGLTQILMRCASESSCMIFMPRIDLWAVEQHDQGNKKTDYPLMNLEVSENKSCSPNSEVSDNEGNLSPSAKMAGLQDALQRVSDLWSSFVEQVESICVSTSLMILATSEVPVAVLPLRIRHFFESDSLDCIPSTHLGGTVPRFSVSVDENFDHDMVIDSSAAKLSNDLARQFVQLIHHRTHVCGSTCKEYKACNNIEGDADTICANLVTEPVTEHGTKGECPVSPVMRFPLPLPTKYMKGKPSLLSAISAFGYQILLYPHFGELCWVTSKLKEGPYADINGPWKGWPFNSCIVRPNNSLEKVVAACSSSNVKSKVQSGLVRGLIAVGLSAYRGVYTSLREVSSEVRKVLELLAGHINAKIQAGKDTYQYIRLLSQVAYLDDMVNSWAYTLQSLEVDAQHTEASPKPSCVESVDSSNISKDNLVQGDEYKPNVPNKSSQESVVQEKSPGGLDAKNIVSIDLKDDNCHHSETEGRPAVLEELSEQCVLHRAVAVPPIHFQGSSSAADSLGVKTSVEQNGVNAESFRSEDSGTHADGSGDFATIRQSNGFAYKDTVVLPSDGPSCSCDSGCVKLSSTGKESNQDNGLSLAGISTQSEDGKLNSASLPTDSGVVCLYGCCSKCLINIYHLMRKILTYQVGLEGSDWTAEDVHDVVTTLSLNLHTTIRKFFLAGSSSNTFEKNLTLDNYSKFFEDREMWTCLCKNSENRLVIPMECMCDSTNKSTAAEVNSSQNLQQWLHSKYIYRDGVLSNVDPEKDASCHCKFKTLCLCSLIEWIVMAKQPLD